MSSPSQPRSLVNEGSRAAYKLTLPVDPLPARPAALDTGAKVEVRSRFDRSWSHGFEVAEHTGDGYRIRRISDGLVLPTDFTEDDVRSDRGGRTSGW